MILTFFRKHNPGHGPCEGVFFFRDASLPQDSPPDPRSRGVTGRSKADLTRAIVAEAIAAGIEIEGVISSHADKHTVRALGLRWINTKRTSREHGNRHQRRSWKPGDPINPAE